MEKSESQRIVSELAAGNPDDIGRWAHINIKLLHCEKCIAVVKMVFVIKMQICIPC